MDKKDLLFFNGVDTFVVYYLINDDYDTDNINEIEIKLKVDEKEYNRILNLIKNHSIKKNEVNQIDTYYKWN